MLRYCSAAAPVTAPRGNRSCVRPSTSWPPSPCRRIQPRSCSCSRRDHYQHDHRDQQDHQPELSVAASGAPGRCTDSSASSWSAAVLTDQPTAHRSVGTKPSASAVLADGDGQDLSIRFHQLAWSHLASQVVIPVPSHHSQLWRVVAWCDGSSRSVGPEFHWRQQWHCCHCLPQ